MRPFVDFGRAILLRLIGGSADAIGYVEFGTFVGAMTGNTVLLGIDLAQWRPSDIIFHGFIILMFLAAVVAGRVAAIAGLPLGMAFVLNAALLGTAGLIETKWGAGLSALAMGVQNSVVRSFGGITLNTAFVTGDLVKLGLSLAEAKRARQYKIALLAAVWIAYAAGAVAGAVALSFTRYAMAVPVLLSLAAAVVEFSSTGRRGPSGVSGRERPAR